MRTFLEAVMRNALAVIGGWLVTLALVQLGQRVLGGWPASEIGQLVGCLVGLAVSFVLNVRLAAYLWGAMAAFSASEVLIHLRYGLSSAQGAPTHFAVMGSAFLAVLIGAWLGGSINSQRAAA